MERKWIAGLFTAFLAIVLLSAAPVWAQGMKGSMKPMESMEPSKGMKPMAGMGGMKMPANAPTVPAVTGYSEGQEILFIHTETSDPKIAKILTAHSDPKRPLIPVQSGHRFRFNPATDSDAKRPVR